VMLLVNFVYTSVTHRFRCGYPLKHNRLSTNFPFRQPKAVL
jgi:hypothetical protein